MCLSNDLPLRVIIAERLTSARFERIKQAMR
ncbi:hypothetical protein J2S11_000863 [Bacillus horti]|uniref:Uncharacterized protein n=1 Tax=Caldalkalibacillus horti TaxID=77523 RepID=A0ABT9VVE2_9BACI|nr:hypothetical protein [Bacillus horti]